MEAAGPESSDAAAGAPSEGPSSRTSPFGPVGPPARSKFIPGTPYPVPPVRRQPGQIPRTPSAPALTPPKPCQLPAPAPVPLPVPAPAPSRVGSPTLRSNQRTGPPAHVVGNSSYMAHHHAAHVRQMTPPTVGRRQSSETQCITTGCMMEFWITEPGPGVNGHSYGWVFPMPAGSRWSVHFTTQRICVPTAREPFAQAAPPQPEGSEGTVTVVLPSGREVEVEPMDTDMPPQQPPGFEES